MKARQKWGWAFLSPTLALFLLFFILPLSYAVYLSFFKANFFERSFVGLANYYYLLNAKLFWQVMRNTVKYWCCMVPASVILPLGLALLIMEQTGRNASIFRAIFYLPVAVGGLVLSTIWVWIFNFEYGILNYFLGLLNLGPIAWLGDPKFSIVSISLVYIVTIALGMFTLIYCAAIGALPSGVIEAAKLDGAGLWALITQIVVPLLKPTIAYVSLCATLASFNLWVYPKLFTEGGPLHSSTSFGYWIYETAFVRGKLGLASAEAIVMLGLTLILSILQLRFGYDLS